MLEPLTAISLASSIVQFVDFGSKLLIVGYDAYRSTEGTKDELEGLETLYADLEAISGKLANAAVTSGPMLSADEQALQRLKTHGKGLRRVYDAVRQEVRRALKSDKIQRLRQDLDDIRNEIVLRLFSILRDQQSELAMTLHGLVAQQKQHQAEMVSLISNAKLELLIAVQQLNNKYTAAAVPGSASYGADAWSLQQNQLDLQLLSSKLSNLQITGYDVTLSNRILDTLGHAKLSSRYAAITDAYDQTYGWILDDASTPFKTWLQQDTESIFWVCGLAGSGKSTLMKYIADEPRTLETLQSARKNVRQVVASFYFWNAGTELEKSLEGLLRSLLFQIICAVPKVTPKMSPKRFLHEDYRYQYSDTWKRKELVQAISAALNDDLLHDRIQFTFFIDGLDEYKDETEDHLRLITMVRRLATSPNVKICVSSRPWKVFKDAFGTMQQPHLLLEELTQDYMRAFTYGELVNHPNFERRLRTDPSIKDLVDEIQHRASGVFLWVFLVVRSLCRGLTAEDSIEKLQERLRALPTDLHKFFRHMLDGVDEHYHVEAARALLILARPRSRDVLALALGLLEEDLRDADYAFGKFSAYGLQLLKESNVKMCNRINIWCKDLIVARARDDYSVLAEVIFLHRTVRDFLVEPDVNAMLQQRAGPEFQPHFTMCRLYLVLLKRRHISVVMAQDETHGIYEESSYGLLEEAKLSIDMDGVSPSRVLNELDKISTSYWSSLCNLARHESTVHRHYLDRNELRLLETGQDVFWLITSNALYSHTRILVNRSAASEHLHPSDYVVKVASYTDLNTASIDQDDPPNVDFLIYCIQVKLIAYVKEKFRLLQVAQIGEIGRLILLRQRSLLEFLDPDDPNDVLAFFKSVRHLFRESGINLHQVNRIYEMEKGVTTGTVYDPCQQLDGQRKDRRPRESASSETSDEQDDTPSWYREDLALSAWLKSDEVLQRNIYGKRQRDPDDPLPETSDFVLQTLVSRKKPRL